MNIARHTPGPWFSDGVARQRYVKDDGQPSSGGAIGVFAEAGIACVAVVVPGCLPAIGCDDAAAANAKIIAAAPAMFDYIARRAAAGDSEAAAIMAEAA